MVNPDVLADLVRDVARDVLLRRDLDVSALPSDAGVERPRNPDHGDYATNVALRTAKKAGVTTVVFDRGGFKYHGRVAALAEAAREKGLNF